MDSPLEVEPGFEPQQRARSNTWPLPRPDNYPDGDEVVVGGGAMGGPVAGGGVMQEGPPPLAASAGGGSAVPVGVSPGVGVAGGVPPGGLPKKNSSRRNAWGNMSYADLITQAIQSAPDKRLTLSQIYEWMVQNVPYFKDKGDSNSSAGWKNSIRHNLSLHNRFMRVQNEGTGKSSWWMINPDAKPGKSARRRAASMETSKFEKRRGRARKKVEALRSAAAAVAAAQPTEHHGGPPHHQQHHGILHGGQPATPSPASSLSESLDLFIESPPPPQIPLQAPGTPAASPFGPPDFRPRASSNASSCGGRLSPIPALDSDSSPLPTRWENGEYSPYDRYATEQLAGNLAEGMKIEEAYLAAQQMRHNGFGEQQSPGSPFPPPPPPPPAYEAYHHHHHHHQQHHQRHPMSGHLAHLPMRHGGRQQQQQEVEMVAYHGMAPSGCQLHPHQQCGCPRPMEATPVDGGIQGHCETMSPGLSPSHLGQNGGYSPTEAQASVPPPPPPPPPLPPATSSSCTSPPAGAVASPASASSPSAPASGALLAASRSPATSVSPSASPATAPAGLPAPSPSEERDVEERRRGGVVVGGGCGSRGGMRGNHHAGSRTPTPSQMMGQLIGVLNNNSRNNNNNEEYLSQQHQPHYNYQVQQSVTGGSFQQHLVDDFSINIETLHGGFDCNVDEVIKHELSMDGSLDFNFCQQQQQQQQQHQQHQQQMHQLQHQLHPHHHHPGHPVQHHPHQQQHHHHHHHQQLHLVQHHIQEGHLGHSFQPHHAFHPHLLQGGGVPGGGGGAVGGGVGHGGEQDLLGGHHATAGAAVGQQGVVPFVTTVATGPSWVH